MKTKLLLLCLILASVNLYSQCPDGTPPAGYTCIPDLAFEEFLIEYSIDSNPIPDQQVLTSALSSVTQLPIYNRGISSLEGIQDFTNLQTLFCYGNTINNLDLSNNFNLEILDCNNNQLNSLILPNSGSLQHVYCFDNNLNEIDVSNNLNLGFLNCSGNPLNGLNLENNALLGSLYCNNTGLYDLDVTNNINLISLRCEQNYLSYLDLSNNTFLVEIIASFNLLTELDVSNNSNLVGLYCNYNQLQYLNIQNGNNAEISEFSAIINPLTCIQVDDVNSANMNTGWYKDDEAEYMLSCPNLGIDEFNELSVLIYPNPSKDKIYVNLELDVKYKLKNSLGQEMQKGTFTNGDNTLDISNFTNGLYFLNVKTNEGAVTKKIIKH